MLENRDTLVNVSNLSFAYEKEYVLQDINLQINTKDFLVLIGPNGGGKSTLAKLILGINKVKEGSIEFVGSSLRSTHIGYVPQNTNVNLDFPIKAIEVVMLNNSTSKKSMFGYTKDERNRAMQTLKKVNMDTFAHSKIGSLSGGQRQRIMIARALYSNPDILLLDEPTSSIDADGQKQVYELLKELNKDVTIIVISHDLSVILEYATKVAHINKKLSYHDLGSIKKEFSNNGNHICEVELLQMLGKCEC